MRPSAYDLKSFYASRTGRVVRRILQDRIEEIWLDTKDLRLVGYGYAAPYLSSYNVDAERVIALMPAGQGAHQWYPPRGSKPKKDCKNLSCLCDQSEIPLETNSVDSVLMIHGLEYCETPEHNLAEIWRVLKSNGRLIVVVPNRSGFWARADWAPFGQGTPFSVSQLCGTLRENMFVHERTEEALFMPPIRYQAVLKLAAMCEKIGRNILPFAAGVHIVEASKQLYARSTPKGHGARTKGRNIFIPKPALNRFEKK